MDLEQAQARYTEAQLSAQLNEADRCVKAARRAVTVATEALAHGLDPGAVRNAVAEMLSAIRSAVDCFELAGTMAEAMPHERAHRNQGGTDVAVAFGIWESRLDLQAIRDAVSKALSEVNSILDELLESGDPQADDLAPADA